MRSGLRCDLGVPVVAPEWARLGARISAAQPGADADALHAAALLDLLTGAPGNSLDRSISYLEMSTRLAPRPDRFVDLSAGYLVRSGRDHDARSALAAVDAAARAVEMDSTNAAARFDLALALRELGLFEEARTELQRFVLAAGNSPWAREASGYISGLAIDTIAGPSDSATSPDVEAAFARLHSNEARGRAWDHLAGWSRAYSAGDATGAERYLRLAEAAGKAIKEFHLDAVIADAAHAVRVASPAVKARLAIAHRAFSDGQALSRLGKSADAARVLDGVERIAAESPALAAWASYLAGNNRLGLADPAGAERAMRRLLDSPVAARYPALIARANWTLGVIELRSRRATEGTPRVERARLLYESLGETEFLGATTGQLGEGANLAGDSRRAYDLLTDALHLLREYPLSNWRHNTLLVMARAAATDGFTAAGARIEAEDEAASRVANRLPALVESELTRARNSEVAGDSAAARRAVTEGRTLAARLPSGNVREQLEADLTVEEANLGASDRAHAMAALDTAVQYFGSIANYLKQLRAYSARATMSMHAGNLAAADADLDEALTIYQQRRAESPNAAQGSLLTQQARRVADALTMVRIARRDTAGAWAARERSRESALTPAKGERPGMVVELALIGDTLVAFTGRGQSITVTTSAVDAAVLRSEIETAGLSLERGASATTARGVLERLYEVLITPVSQRLRASDSVVTIIARGILSRVPFAALRNARTGEYLIERHALRFASSLRQAGEAPRPLSGRPRALLVADPVIDRRTFPGLAPLGAAGEEVDSIAGLFDTPKVIRGTAADTATIKHALRSAELFHFAGHAMLDDARPERSQLVMGSRGLSAAAIASLPLASLRLVVLSACETNRAPIGAGEGFLGLTDSFLAAGAGGVVGSLWKVDDESTREMMVAFYAALQRTHDPATALRDAQRSMRAAPPGAWAGFQYAGQ
jgi:CHAT domain-containing protein